MEKYGDVFMNMLLVLAGELKSTDLGGNKNFSKYRMIPSNLKQNKSISIYFYVSIRNSKTPPIEKMSCLLLILLSDCFHTLTFSKPCYRKSRVV